MSLMPSWFKHPLARELALVLALKLALLFGLWWLCFSSPQQAGTAAVSARVLGAR